MPQPIITKQQRRRMHAKQMTWHRIKSLAQSRDRCLVCQKRSQDCIDTYEQPIASERLLRASGLSFAFKLDPEDRGMILSFVGSSLPFCLDCATKHRIPLTGQLTRCACGKKAKYFCDECDAPICNQCRTKTGLRMLGVHEIIDTVDVCPHCLGGDCHEGQIPLGFP
jgi:hypothetical protein